MSRNKDIDFIHQFTGWSYKESRRRYHKSGNSVSRTLMIDSDSVNTILNLINQTAKGMSDALSEILNCVINTIKAIDWEHLAEFAKQMKESQNEDQRDNSI